MVSGRGGLGVHAPPSIHRPFPGYHRNVVLLSVGVIGPGHFEGETEVESLIATTERGLERCIDLARRLGCAVERRYRMGTDVAQGAEQIRLAVQRAFPKGVFFLGKLLFAQDGSCYRFRHNDTAFAVQRRLQFKGLPTINPPTRIRPAAPSWSLASGFAGILRAEIAQANLSFR